MKKTLYWHDYETWGTDPSRDRASQFAGLRTDLDLNPIGEPLVIYCKPADDLLPQPDACLVTGVSPQKALAEGLVEAEFIARIHGELAQPGTCSVGYNSIRFDDEVTRQTLYRNFYDPYSREWQHGNSRWDIIDMVRLTFALRPEGLNWPKYPDGKQSFRLEQLTAANGIVHTSAHDALSDVEATIALARLIRQQQPRLYDYIFKQRGKRQVAEMLNLQAVKSVVHISSMYPSESGCMAVVMPLAKHPKNSNGIIVYDLSRDPEPLLSLNEDEIHHRLFTASSDLPEGVERIPLKTIHLNKAPIVVPMNTLTAEIIERWQLDITAIEKHRQQIIEATGLMQKIVTVHQQTAFEPITDPDRMLYSGGFFSDADRRKMDAIRQQSPSKLVDWPLNFDDPRLPEMFFRYRARNWPESLTPDERQRWCEYRRERLYEPEGGGSMAMVEYNKRLRQLRDMPEFAERKALFDELEAWGEMVGEISS
ncbi:MAG: exodeoxyribonuclease I [Candidatus Polarisedimenticolaceae bacterium]|nr:exodeoxyribonuclease I [Candidatus Polarisedimenticolaceae bacterium]